MTGHVAEAVESLKKAFELKNLDVLVVLGHALLDLGRFQEFDKLIPLYLQRRFNDVECLKVLLVYTVKSSEATKVRQAYSSIMIGMTDEFLAADLDIANLTIAARKRLELIDSANTLIERARKIHPRNVVINPNFDLDPPVAAPPAAISL